MERQTRRDAWTVGLLLGGLLALGLWAGFFHRGDFSDRERRYLSEAPALPRLHETWKTDREVESYLSDRVPMRHLLVGINAGMSEATGRVSEMETWHVGDAIVEQPVTGQRDTILRRAEQFERLAGEIGAPVYFLTPPTHGFLLKESMPGYMGALYDGEADLLEALRSTGKMIELPEEFAASPETVYYRTDHHWTLDGASMAYDAVCRAMGFERVSQEDFTCREFPGFYGTTFSRSGLLFARADTIRTAEKEGGRLYIGDSGETFDYLIFPEHAETYDGYAVYLGGNHGYLEITGENADGGTLLVYKDSFANCLLPLLAASFRKVVAVDVRYYAGSAQEAARAAGDVDAILCCYSLDSLMNDTNLARKLR
ncbi:MAG: hypothetical protein IJ083_15535 [Clostridia bacterium]|nr:hypothetical protein [Clostridia bacterium]